MRMLLTHPVDCRLGYGFRTAPKLRSIFRAASVFHLQAVLYECLRHLTLAVAPLVPFVAEDIYHHSAELLDPSLATGKRDFLMDPTVPSSVFDVLLPAANGQWSNTAVGECWAHVLDVHSKVNAVAETARKDGAIGSSLEASVVLGLSGNPPVHAYLEDLRAHNDLTDVLSCSQVIVGDASAVSSCDSFHDKSSGLFNYYAEAVVMGSTTPVKSVMVTLFLHTKRVIRVVVRLLCRIQLTNAKGKKCQRCWKYCESVTVSLGHELCSRCVRVLDK
jgi:isoleucyl-tRNA synthetase